LVCCTSETDETSLNLVRESAKADLVAGSMGEAVRLCVEAAQAPNPTDRLETLPVLERGAALAT
jgi:hypothetical protein